MATLELYSLVAMYSWIWMAASPVCSPTCPNFHHSLLPYTRSTSFVSFICLAPCLHMSLQVFCVSVFRERLCTPFNKYYSSKYFLDSFQNQVKSHTRTRCENAMWGQGQRQEWCSCKPRNTKDGRQPPEARKRQRSVLLRVSEGTWPCWHHDFRLLASGTVSQ